MGDGLGPVSFKDPIFFGSPLETLPFKMSGWKVILFFFLVGGRQRGGKQEEEWEKIVVVCKKDLKSEKLK